MPIALAIFLFTLGCATQTPRTPAAPERTTASASSITLNIQANEIKEIAVLDNTASTVCSATGTDRTDAGNVYYSCVTTVRVGIRVVSPYLHIDQVYGGMDNYVITGYGSRNALAEPSPNVGAAKELANVQANSLAALGRRYRKLADGCMGEAVALTYGADKIDLQTGAYFGDLLCKIKRKNAKIAAGSVYYLEMAKSVPKRAEAVGAQGAQLLVEGNAQSSELIGWMTTQAIDRTKDAAQRSAAFVTKTTAPMKDYVSATYDSLTQAQQRTRAASADALRSLSDQIRP